MPQGLVLASLVGAAIADVDVSPTDASFRFVGRFDSTSSEPRFDRNGAEIQFQTQGATQITAKISQRLTAPYVDPDAGPYDNPVGSVAHHFLVYVDGTPLKTPISGSECTYCTFDTTGIVASAANETVTEYVIATGLSQDAHEIRIVKTTEPEWNDREPSPNWITFHGLSLDAGKIAAPSASRPQRRIEFIGDSITAGYCNLCKGPGPFDDALSLNESVAGGEAQETFALSWPTVICDQLGAECSTLAWSGLGLIKNCCGGATYMPEIWTRTLATADTGGSNNWDFSSWVPDALVVNLGTNDGGQGATPEFVEAYQQLVKMAHDKYGDGLDIFLACGPMSETYCDSVQQTLAYARTIHANAHFLDHRGFLNGTFGPACCGHPGVQVDTAMGNFGANVIANIKGWNAGAQSQVLV